MKTNLRMILLLLFLAAYCLNGQAQDSSWGYDIEMIYPGNGERLTERWPDFTITNYLNTEQRNLRYEFVISELEEDEDADSVLTNDPEPFIHSYQSNGDSLTFNVGYYYNDGRGFTTHQKYAWKVNVYEENDTTLAGESEVYIFWGRWLTDRFTIQPYEQFLIDTLYFTIDPPQDYLVSGNLWVPFKDTLILTPFDSIRLENTGYGFVAREGEFNIYLPETDTVQYVNDNDELYATYDHINMRMGGWMNGEVDLYLKNPYLMLGAPDSLLHLNQVLYFDQARYDYAELFIPKDDVTFAADTFPLNGLSNWEVIIPELPVSLLSGYTSYEEYPVQMAIDYSSEFYFPFQDSLIKLATYNEAMSQDLLPISINNRSVYLPSLGTENKPLQLILMDYDLDLSDSLALEGHESDPSWKGALLKKIQLQVEGLPSLTLEQDAFTGTIDNNGLQLELEYISEDFSEIGEIYPFTGKWDKLEIRIEDGVLVEGTLTGAITSSPAAYPLENTAVTMPLTGEQAGQAILDNYRGKSTPLVRPFIQSIENTTYKSFDINTFYFKDWEGYYLIEVAEDEAFTNYANGYDQDNLSDVLYNPYTIDSLKSNTTYFIRLSEMIDDSLVTSPLILTATTGQNVVPEAPIYLDHEYDYLNTALRLEWQVSNYNTIVGHQVERANAKDSIYEVIQTAYGVNEIYSYSDYEIEDGEAYSYRLTIHTEEGYASHTTPFLDAFRILGSEKVLAQKLNLYPNPVEKELMLQHLPLGTKEISLHDISGKLIRVNPVHSQITKLNVEDLKAGVYFIKVQTDNENVVRRFIKK